MEGAFRLTDQVQAHTSGYNHFEWKDSVEIGLGLLLSLGGYGTVLLRSYGRFVLMVCCLFRIAGSAIVGWTALNMARELEGRFPFFSIVLAGATCVLPVTILLTLWREWRKAGSGTPSALSPRWRNFAALAVLFGAGMSLSSRLDVGEEIAPYPNLDSGCLRRADDRTFVETWPGRKSRGWRMSMKEKDGKLELYPFPPGGACLARFEPGSGTLSLSGYAFAGRPYAAAPKMVREKKLHGMMFSRDWGSISGQFTFGEDDRGNLYLFMNQLQVYGKTYDGIWFSPSAPRK